MKKLIILTLLATTLSLHAITPTGGIKVSTYQTNVTMMFYDSHYLDYEILPKYAMEIEYKLGAQINDYFYVGGRIDTYMALPKEGSIYFRPFQNDYFITAAFTLGMFSLGIEHICYHPVSTAGDNYVGKYGGYSSAFVEWEF